MEAQPSHVAGTVRHAHNDGLSCGYAEIDIVPSVDNQTQARADVVARDAAVAYPGDAFHVTTEVRNVTRGGRGTADRLQTSIDRSEVTSRSTRDDQLLRRNGVSPPQR